MTTPPTLAGLLESFFRRRLVDQRNASPATVESYRDEPGRTPATRSVRRRTDEA